MELIAIRDFARVQGMQIINVGTEGVAHKVEGRKDNCLHDNHVHKGARFSLGNWPPEELNINPINDEKKLASMLIFGHCAVEATEKNIKRVMADVEADKRRAANHARLEQQAAQRLQQQATIAEAQLAKADK
jgi:hypothetical protein